MIIPVATAMMNKITIIAVMFKLSWQLSNILWIQQIEEIISLYGSKSDRKMIKFVLWTIVFGEKTMAS